MAEGIGQMDEQGATEVVSMNYLRLFPEWNFYTRPDCNQEPPADWHLSGLGKNYKTGTKCLVLTAAKPINPEDQIREDLDFGISVAVPLEYVIGEEGCGVPVGTRLLSWLEAISPLHGWECQHHDNPDHWICVIAWRSWP